MIQKYAGQSYCSVLLFRKKNQNRVAVCCVCCSVLQCAAAQKDTRESCCRVFGAYDCV